MRVTIHNPASRPVVVGASVRRRSLRLRSEGEHFVTTPRATAGDRYLASRHGVLCAVAAQSRTVLIPVPDGVGRHGELVLAIGEAQRLRVVHLAVELVARAPAQPRRCGPPD